MLSYRVILDVPLPLVLFVSKLLADHRREIGTRDGTRALTCWKQAVFTLAWFRDRPDIRRLGQGFGISQATAYRYKDEAIEVLAAKAPTLREALDRAAEQELPYLILDGTLISSDRCADKKTSKKGREIDKWYSGKAHEAAGNVQALAAPPSSNRRSGSCICTRPTGAAATRLSSIRRSRAPGAAPTSWSKATGPGSTSKRCGPAPRRTRFARTKLREDVRQWLATLGACSAALNGGTRDLQNLVTAALGEVVRAAIGVENCPAWLLRPNARNTPTPGRPSAASIRN